jgi:hypothetical protein
MAEAQKAALYFINSEKWQTKNGKDAWTFETNEGGRYSTFDPRIAQHLADKLDGEQVEIEFTVTKKNDKTYRNIVAIPGAVDRQSYSGSKGGGGGMSDKQAAIIAAAILHAPNPRELNLPGVFATAHAIVGEYFGSSGGGSGESGDSGSPPGSTSSGASAPSSWASDVEPAAGDDPAIGELEGLMREVWPNRPGLARTWLTGKLSRFGVASLEACTVDQLAELATDLTKIAGERTS